MRGAWGEENTRDELARARRRRLTWGRVDSLSLEYGDIDHLVVTRAGGIVAIDSKWRTDTNPGDRDAMGRAAQRDGERVDRAAARGLLDRLERFRATAWETAK